LQFATSCINAGLDAVEHFVHGVGNTGSQVALPSGLAARMEIRLDATEVNCPAHGTGPKVLMVSSLPRTDSSLARSSGSTRTAGKVHDFMDVSVARL
jgi:hypothetical protein